MATSTINTSSKYVDLIVTTSCALSGNYPNIKAVTSYNFKFKCTKGYASCNYNNYTFSFDGQQSKSSVNFYLDEGEISGAYGADKKEYNLGNSRKITKTVKAGCDGLWDASDDISFTSPSVEAPTNYGLTVSDITAQLLAREVEGYHLQENMESEQQYGQWKHHDHWSDGQY